MPGSLPIRRREPKRDSASRATRRVLARKGPGCGLCPRMSQPERDKQRAHKGSKGSKGHEPALFAPFVLPLWTDPATMQGQEGPDNYDLAERLAIQTENKP